MDENASADHRFFLPDITLDTDTQEIAIWTGYPKPNLDIDDWMIVNEDGSYDIFTLTDPLIVKKSKGESIFLRDPNRQIVLWRYWDGEVTVEPSQIFTSCQSNTIKMWVDNREYVVNHQSHQLDVPPQIYDGSTFVPLRALGDALGCVTLWYPESRRIEYSYQNPCDNTNTVLDLWIEQG